VYTVAQFVFDTLNMTLRPIATRNIRHFEGLDVPVIDPWNAWPGSRGGVEHVPEPSPTPLQGRNNVRLVHVLLAC
jgi:hypothetical protein